MAHTTVGGMVLDRIAKTPNRPALKTKQGDTWVETSWAEFGKRMERIAAGLLTAIDGLEEHAAVAILGNTSGDWITCDFAALSVGLRTVPVYATLLPPEVGYLHVDTGAVIAICEDREQLEKVREMRKGFSFFEQDYTADDVKVRHIVVMDPTGCEGDDFETLEALEARGEAKLAETEDDRKRRLAAMQRDQTCTYTYTSGTTGPPKGVIQTNGNMLSMLESVDETGLFGPKVQAGGLFLFLPLAHSFGRLIELAGPFFDAAIIVSSIPTLVDDLGATKPGFFPAAPRVFEKMKARIESKVAGAPPMRQRLFHWAIDTGKATIPYRSNGEPIPFFLGLKHSLADRLVLSKLRGALGFDNADILLSGSAPLNVEVHAFFLAMGLNLLEAYGLTETCPGLTSNLPKKFKIGTVGMAFPGVTIKIAEDGEILAKGGNITSGYLNREDATSEAFDADGWFCTGDLGAMDDEGFVKITGRKKELMKTSGGKYIAPAKLEAKLKDLTFVQESVTIADTRNYVTALVALDPEELAEWAKQTGNSADPQSDAVRQAVQEHVDKVNESLARYETIKYFRIVDPMTVESGLLTASLKVKRKVVQEKYHDLIEEMYKSGKGD
ncbi:MAG: long-chain fatty acid--CoA ligase [Alphaproteobacteria bacterium]|nr:long-chain fatty acid--CoA ligase [Alphaproteobacteria bacterium]